MHVILATIVLAGHEEHSRRIRDAMLTTTPDPADQLPRFVRAHVLFHAEYPVLGMVANAELALRMATPPATDREGAKRGAQSTTTRSRCPRGAAVVARALAAMHVQPDGRAGAR